MKVKVKVKAKVECGASPHSLTKARKTLSEATTQGRIRSKSRILRLLSSTNEGAELWKYWEQLQSEVQVSRILRLTRMGGRPWREARATLSTSLQSKINGESELRKHLNVVIEL